MTIFGFAIALVGLALWLGGQVWFSVVAFRKSPGWGFGVAVPFVGWYLLATHPAYPIRWPFGLRLGGQALLTAGWLTISFANAPVVGDPAAAAAARGDSPDTAVASVGRPLGVPEVLEAVVAPRRLANGAGFDLIALDDGAALVYGPTVEDGGGIALLRLDRMGVVQGAPIPVFTPERAARLDGRLGILELRAVQSADRIAVAWLEPGPSGWVARATVGGLEGFEAPVRLGAVPEPRRTTGRLAIAGNGIRGFRVAWHQGSRACSRAVAESTGAEECMILRVSDLPPTRDALNVVEVPGGCDPAIAGGAYAGGRYAFAACGLWNEQPNLSLIRPGQESAYQETQVGCPPNGLAAVDDHLVGTARCGSRTHWIRFTANGEAEGASEVTEACSEGMPLPSGAGRALRPDETVGKLAALLSDRVAAANARAVWTGAMVLVASTTRGEVSLKRWGCWDGHFLRIDTL